MSSPVRHLLSTLLLILLAAPAYASGPEKASIVLQWQPQAQFAGFFVAKDKGFYEEAGIDLTIIPGGPDILASEYLEAGKAQYATMFLSSALQRRMTLPIVNIGQFVQDSALMLITLEKSGIKNVEDLDLKKVGLWANEFQIQPRALFRRKEMKVTVVPQSSSLDLFLRGGVQAASGMWYNEYHTLLSYGLDESELKPFFFKDMGLNFPEDGIYCLEKAAREKPEMNKALVQATIRGWQYAFDHPDEALDSVMTRMEQARIPANRTHQRWMLDRMKDIILGENGYAMGVLHKEDFDLVSGTLLETGFIDKAPDYSEFYKGAE